jgi:methylenetetrahydromethanopterin dehydrogenase
LGVVKAGCIGTLPILEFLLDERADRQDIDVRVVGAGAKMDPAHCEAVANEIVPFKPDFAVFISPNATIAGPTRGEADSGGGRHPDHRDLGRSTKKIAKDLEAAGFGYIIIEADSMIGARREFLDPTEMAVFNAEILKVLAVTGVFNLICREFDCLIGSVKRGEKLQLPHVVINKERAVAAAGFENPYARAKAMAAHEASCKVSDLTVEGCFIVREWERYTQIVAAAHEIMRGAARLADEAREIEKGGRQRSAPPTPPGWGGAREAETDDEAGEATGLG